MKAFSALTQKVTNSIETVKQFANEKLGSPDPECITELPQEYVVLERKLDKVKALYESLLKLSSNFTNSDYDPTVSESFKEAVDKLNHMVKGNQEQPEVVDNYNTSLKKENAPKTFGHALARATSSSALDLGEHEPLGAALKKFSSAQDRVGDARLKMESEIIGRFVRPWSATLNTNIQFATKAKKQVHHQQTLLTGAKMRYKSVSTANNVNSESLMKSQNEMQQLEEELLISVKDASHKIHLVVDSAEPLRNISELVSVQLTFFKESYEALNEISAEIDEMQVTQEALFRSN